MEQANVIVNNAFRLTTKTYHMKMFKPQIIGGNYYVTINLSNLRDTQLLAFFKILDGKTIIPMVDISSHMDVYNILRITQIVNGSIECIYEGFSQWTEKGQWISLQNPEYMYLIYNIAEELVDYKQFFRLHKQPFDHFPIATTLHDIRADPVLFIEMVSFYTDYQFEKIFNNNNEDTQARIEILNNKRNEVSLSFLINPYDDFMESYFNYHLTNYPVWDCEGISIVEPLEIGTPVLAPIGVAMERFNDLTYNLFIKSLNPNVKDPFPFENVAFAGGFISKILSSNYTPKYMRQSDVDIFPFASTFEGRSKLFEKILRWFDSPETYYAIRGAVTTIYIVNLKRKFQIISTNAPSVFDVIGRFDLTHIQWCLWNNTFYGTSLACKSMREKVSRSCNVNRLRIVRLVKALRHGYSIFKGTDILENHYDITELISNPTENVQLQKILRELSGFYYPQNDESMEPEEQRQYILSMIEKDACATLVHYDINFVLNNVIVSSNFESDYESISYTTFNVNNLQTRANVRRIGRQLMRSKHGNIKLTSGNLNVEKVIVNDNGLEIIVKSADDSFHMFIRDLEGLAFRLYAGANRAITHHIVDEETGCMKIIMPQYKLDAQAVKGISCMRSQRGVPLNIEEDLKDNDVIQMLFCIEVINENDIKAIEFKALKFIKYCKYNPDDKVCEDNDNIDEEISKLEDDIETLICYEDVEK